MPIISFASPKGGVGKSTSALILATELAHRGADVAIIDADPNKVLVEWSRLDDVERITVRGDVTEDTMLDVIFEEVDRVKFVIVDLEGSKNLMMATAIANSDFVVVPMNGSHVDALRAAEAIKMIKMQERSVRRPIPYSALFTRANAAIVTRDERAVRGQLEGQGIPIFDTKIVDRAAYRALFAYGGGVRDLPKSEVSGIAAATENAAAFAAEMIEKLKMIGEGA